MPNSAWAVLCRGDVGLVPAPGPTALTDPVELLVAEFVGYLMRERGLRDGSHTVWEYRRTARLFLTGRLDPDGGGLERVTAGDVTGFVLTECRHRSRRMSGALVSTLRGLLRFLFLEGLLSADLTGAVPKVASWRCASLPKALPSEDVARLLASCDRMTAVGRRDFAILLMLSRLGLRACEVAKLRLADIDWRAGELIVRGKQDRHERLPLPTAVSYCTSVDPVFGFCVDVARVRDALAAVLIDVWPELDPQPSARAAPGLQPAVADPVVDGAL